MPDRNLREVSLGMAGRLGAIESRQRAMTGRVWPGAMRTADADSYIPTTQDQFNTIIQMEVLPGRWLMMAEFDLRYPVVASIIRAEMKLAVSDAVTGVEEPSSVDYDLPTRFLALTITGFYRTPMTLIGHMSNETDNNKVVAIKVRDAEGETWTAHDIRLNLIPR